MAEHFVRRSAGHALEMSAMPIGALAVPLANARSDRSRTVGQLLTELGEFLKTGSVQDCRNFIGQSIGPMKNLQLVEASDDHAAMTSTARSTVAAPTRSDLRPT